MKHHQIALFGTSADPPTIGHEAILIWLSQHYDHVGVWASDNPFKNHQTSLEHRNQMLRLLVASLNQAHPNLSFHRELSHLRSFITVQKATQLWGNNVEFTLVIGSDLIGQIQDWYRVEELFQQTHLLIITRPGYAVAEEGLKRLSQLGATYQLSQFQIPDVSSSGYRQTQDPSFLPQAVAQYIHKYNLYSGATVR